MHLKLLILVVSLSFYQLHFKVFTFDMYTFIEKSMASCHYVDNILSAARKVERSRNFGTEQVNSRLSNKGNVDKWETQWDLRGRRRSLVSRSSLIETLKSYIPCVLSYWEQCSRMQALDVRPPRQGGLLSNRPCFLAKLVLSVANFALEIEVYKMFHLRLQFLYFNTQYASLSCSDQYVVVSAILNLK